jgi:hypothetical protein
VERKPSQQYVHGRSVSRTLTNAPAEKGLNPFDVRKPCKGSTGLCYEEDAWIKTYLNRADVKDALGVPENVKFSGKIYLHCDVCY